MAESTVGVTVAATPDKNLHTNSRTIGANTVEDEVTILGEPYLATYSATAQNVSLATADSHVIQLMAGASLIVRVHRIVLASVGGTAGNVRLTLLRLTAAGSGGTVITARPYDTADSASGATAMTLPTTKGTEGVTLGTHVFGFPDTSSRHEVWEWVAKDNIKPIYIPAGTANGIAIKNSAIASVGADIVIEFTEANF